MKRISFKIYSCTKEREVTGYEAAPGVAIHRLADFWTVTHTNSGLGLIPSGIFSFKLKREAVAYVEKLLKIFPDVNWQQNSEKVDVACREVIRKRFRVLPPGGFYSAMKQLLEAKSMPVISKAQWEIANYDVLDGLKAVPDSRYGLAQLIFADPPYNQGIDYGKGKKADKLPREVYLNWCRLWLSLCRDALTPNGSLWVLVPDEWVAYYAVALDELGLTRRNWIKWYETFGVNCTHKFNRCSRHLLYYVNDPKQFVFNRDAVSRPSDRQSKYSDKRANPDGKRWDDVWQIPRLAGTHKERIKGFPTQLPLALLRPIVQCTSDPGDIIVDPFSGSATTGVAAIESGRRYVGIEKSEEFCRLSRKRLVEVSRQSAD